MSRTYDLVSRTYNINWQQYAYVFLKLPDLACHPFLLSIKLIFIVKYCFYFSLTFGSKNMLVALLVKFCSSKCNDNHSFVIWFFSCSCKIKWIGLTTFSHQIILLGYHHCSYVKIKLQVLEFNIQFQTLFLTHAT